MATTLAGDGHRDGESLDGAAYTTYTAPVTVTEAGAHTMKYKATEKAGNTSPEDAAIFTIRTS